MVSMSGSSSAQSATTLGVSSVVSQPAFSSNLSGLFNGVELRPDLGFNNATPDYWADDDTVAIHSSPAVSTSSGTLNLASSSSPNLPYIVLAPYNWSLQRTITGSPPFRSIDILDYVDITGGATVESFGDLFAVNGQLSGSGISGIFRGDTANGTTGSTNLPITLNSGTYFNNITTSGLLTLSGATLGNSAYPVAINAGSISISGGNIYSSSITTTNGDLTMTGGNVSHPATTNSTNYSLVMNLAGNLEMNGGSIKVDGLGYPASYSYGSNGVPSAQIGSTGGGTGGSHGGRGSYNNNFGNPSSVGATYDDYRNPSFPGGGSPVLAGGGVVRITASQFCNFSGGTISANGASSASTNSTGGGAGGSIYLNCAGFGGSTTEPAITANGGAGNTGGTCSISNPNTCGAGGGGGRIALVSQGPGPDWTVAAGSSTAWEGNFTYPTGSATETLADFKSVVQAFGGAALPGTHSGNGGAGSIFIQSCITFGATGCNFTPTMGDLIIDNNGLPPTPYDGTTTFLSATDNSNELNALGAAISPTSINVTTSSTTYANENNIYAGAILDIWDGSNASSPKDGIYVLLNGNGNNNYTVSGNSPTSLGTASNQSGPILLNNDFTSVLSNANANTYGYRFTYVVDHLDIAGFSNVDMTNSDLWVLAPDQYCDFHDPITKFSVANTSGTSTHTSNLVVHSFASGTTTNQYCSTVCANTTGCTINSASYGTTGTMTFENSGTY